MMNYKNSDLNLIFSTPVWTSVITKYNEINKKMYNYIKSLQSKNPEGTLKSNLEGWHSENFDLKAEEIVFFVNSISPSLNSSFNDMQWDVNNLQVKITSMWSIINNKNASNSRHIHSNNYISAAYYVKAPNNCGDIVFHDPRSAAVFRHPRVLTPNKLNSNIYSVQPKEGLLVLFPSYLQHSVDKNNSNEERIVISFNIDLK